MTDEEIMSLWHGDPSTGTVLDFARAIEAKARQEQLEEMVNRFLGWKLPQDFAPDCGISFDGRGPDARGFQKEWPIGTNLFTAEQARQMFEYVLASQPLETESRKDD